MSDISTCHLELPRHVPHLMDKTDLRSYHSDCRCPVCRNKPPQEKSVRARFEEYGSITLEAHTNLNDHAYLLCPKEIRAFVFKTRQWGKDYDVNISKIGKLTFLRRETPR